jgi:hypothetical protein
VYGLLFPVDVDPSATTLPAPPAITFLSPVLPLVTIATNQPIPGYGVRYRNGGGSSGSSGSSGGCTIQPGGGTICGGGVSGPGAPAYVSVAASSATTVSSGLFEGWQYWQASVVMQLVICALALALSAYVLPPVRRLRLRRPPKPAAAAE